MEISSISLSVNRPPSTSSLLLSSSRSSLFTAAFFPSKKTGSLVSGRPRNRTWTGPTKKGLTCNALFGLGVPELVVIAGVAALVFGPKKLPEVGKSIGKTVRSFQEAAKEFESELKKEPDSSTESEAEKSKEVRKEEEREGGSSKESL